jgi:hypothetical protein
MGPAWQYISGNKLSAASMPKSGMVSTDSPYFITVFGTSFAWDRQNWPEDFTTETSNHGRRSGGVVVEMSE